MIAGFSGNMIENIVRTPGSLLTRIFSLWLSAICFAMERPFSTELPYDFRKYGVN